MNNNMQHMANQQQPHQQQFPPGMNPQVPGGMQMTNQMQHNQMNNMNNQMLGQPMTQGRLQGQQQNPIQIPSNQNNQQHQLNQKMAAYQPNTMNNVNMSPNNLPNPIKTDDPQMNQCSSSSSVAGNSIQNTNQTITTSSPLTSGISTSSLQTPKIEVTYSPCSTNIKAEPSSPAVVVKTEDLSSEVTSEVKMEVGSPAQPVTSVPTSTSTAVVSASSSSAVKSEVASPAPPVKQEPKVFKGKL